MSTRCMIIIEDGYNKILLYRHCDGYPEGAGKDLKRFFTEKRFGYDTHLHDAEQIAHALILWHARNGVRVEPACEIHGDIDYIYVVHLPSQEYIEHKKRDLRVTIKVYGSDLTQEIHTWTVKAKLWDKGTSFEDMMWAGEMKLVAPGYYSWLKQLKASP